MCCSQKHQQAKSLWPRTQADVLLTKHQQAKFLWPQTQDKAAEGKNKRLKLGKNTVIHNSRQRENVNVIIDLNCHLLLRSLGVQLIKKCQHNATQYWRL